MLMMLIIHYLNAMLKLNMYVPLKHSMALEEIKTNKDKE